MAKTTYAVEVTDTFGGEANYCWVKRFDVKASSFTGAIRMAKREAGYTGSHRKSDYGDMVRIDYRNACVCMFISWKED